MERKKADMANSEKLFGLEFTLYPELAEMSKDMEIMDILFHLYLSQKVREYQESCVPLLLRQIFNRTIEG
jgi:hypothetical protein